MLTLLTWITALGAALAGMLLIGMYARVMLNNRQTATHFESLLTVETPTLALKGRVANLLENIGRTITSQEAGSELRSHLARAGFRGNSVIYIFSTLRLVFAAFGALLVYGLYAKGDGISAMTLGLSLFAGLIFFRASVILLKLAGDRRTRLVQKELPAVIDITLMVLDSGVSIDQCLRYVSTNIEKSSPVISGILRKHISEVDSGVPYETALDHLSQRLGIEEAYDFVNIIKQSLLYGGELTTTLRRFGNDLSDKRLARAREDVGRRSTHLTIVMIAFFVPVLMVVLAGPALVTLTQTLSVATQKTTIKHR